MSQMSRKKKKILFVGASGAVAEKVLPFLSERYEIVGISRTRDTLSKYCVQLYKGDLLNSYEQLFTSTFSEHAVEAIIWNPVLYFPQPLLSVSRETLHSEFDLAIALPLECLKYARLYMRTDLAFIFVSSGLAFAQKVPWGSYSIMKRGQVIASEYLAEELKGEVVVRSIILGAVPATPEKHIQKVFSEALEDALSDKVLYKVDAA